MPLLVRHPDTPPGAIDVIEAEVLRSEHGVTATFRAVGRIAELVLPPRGAPQRTDGLWKTTCFELFVQGEGTSYREYNLSPSGAWAAYDFDRPRIGMRDAPAEIDMELSSDDRLLSLTAKIIAQVPNPARVGVCAVIAERDGALRYWAAAFPPGPPDFHAEATRALLLDGVDAQ